MSGDNVEYITFPPSPAVRHRHRCRGWTAGGGGLDLRLASTCGVRGGRHIRRGSAPEPEGGGAGAEGRTPPTPAVPGSFLSPAASDGPRSGPQRRPWMGRRRRGRRLLWSGDMEYIRSPAPPPTPAVLAKARDDSPRREQCYVGFISYSLLLFPEQPVLVSHVSTDSP